MSNKTDASSAAGNTGSSPEEEINREDVAVTAVTQNGVRVRSSTAARGQGVAAGSSSASTAGGGCTDWQAPSSAKRKKLGRPTGSSSGLSREAGGAQQQQSGASDADDWPDCIGDEVRERVENWEMPDGYKKKDRPRNASSLVWYAGVRVVHEDTNAEGWICLASKECAEKNDVLAWTGAMSNWTRHLESFHKLRSNRTVQMQANKKEPADKLSGAKCSGCCKETHSRSISRLE